MAISVVSFSFSWCSTDGSGAQFSAECWLSLPHLVTNGSLKLLGAQRTPSAGSGFPFHILSATFLVPNSIGGPDGLFGRVWLSLPHLVTNSVRSLTLWLFVLTELYKSSTPTQSPTQSLEWHDWSSSSGNNCHAVQRSLSSVASVYECIMGFYLVPFHQPNPLKRSLSITGHWNVSLSFGASLWKGMFGRVEGQNTTHRSNLKNRKLEI